MISYDSRSIQADVLLAEINEQMNNIMSEREKHRLHKLDVEQSITLTKESLKQEDLLHENLGDGMMRRYVFALSMPRYSTSSLNTVESCACSKKGPRRVGKGRPDEFFMDRRKL